MTPAKTLALTLALGPMTLAPTHAAETVEAEAVLIKMREQLGDPADLAARRNVTMHGKANWGGLEPEGLVTEVYAGLTSFSSKTEFPATLGSVENGCNGSRVWERSMLGIRIREGWDASQYARVYAISQHLDWRELYVKAETAGMEEIEGKMHFKLLMFPKPLFPLSPEAQKEIPPPDDWYVDSETYRLRRLEAKSVGTLGEPTIMRVEYQDWRPHDGVQYPHLLHVEVSGFELEVIYDAIQHDTVLAEGFFEPDEEILAAIAEADSTPAGDDQAVKTEMLAERHIASIRVTCTQADLQKTLSVLLPEAMQHVLAVGASMDGPPLVRYHTWGDPIDLEAGMPLKAAIVGKGRVKAESLPAGLAVVAWHVGPYHRLGETHERLQAYLDANGFVQRASPWEEYWTDPGLEPDPGKWRTKVIYPVEKKSAVGR